MIAITGRVESLNFCRGLVDKHEPEFALLDK